MNTQIKNFLVILLLIFTAASGFAQESAPADFTVDLSITISSLHRSILSGRDIPPVGTPVVFNGTVLERRLIDAERETFAGEITLAGGEWISDEEVKVYKYVILLNGPDFAETIPARRSRNENPNELTLNSEIIVYAKYLGWAETEYGPIAVLEAGGIRKL